jgi:hypothetical protein
MRLFEADFNTLGAHPGRIVGVLDLELLGERVRLADGEALECEGTVRGLRIDHEGSHLLVDIEIDPATWKSADVP